MSAWLTDLQYKNREIRKHRLRVAREKATHTKEEWLALIAEFGGRCVRCCGPFVVVKDHIIPLYQGGSDGIENLQPLCINCNSGKGSENFNWVLHRRANQEI